MVKRYFENLAKALFGVKVSELGESEKHVLESIANQAPIVTDVNSSFQDNLTFGQRVADKVAQFGGSWTFIGLFALVMFTWMALNTWLWVGENSFDPFPFILLNLVLSTLAAIQAPIIMMSQNRQAAKDRLASDLNYEVSLKTEIEIMRLHQKIDSLMQKQDVEDEQPDV